ncbi:MAG: hypothetical protein DYG90_04535 [Chloroflexi bacterium CFX6]|nr:hypothetical protein [Chloroflexi bacterium CFX6]
MVTELDSAHPLPPQPPVDLAGADGAPRRLSIGDVVDVARGGRGVRLLEEDPARQRPLERAMAASAAWVDAQVADLEAGTPRPIYGINTGFGALAGRETFRSRYHARVLSRNLLVSHSAGTGDPLDEDVVRAGMLIRSHQLASGRSGIRVGVVNRLLAMLNARVYPRVPSMGLASFDGECPENIFQADFVAAHLQNGPLLFDGVFEDLFARIGLIGIFETDHQCVAVLCHLGDGDTAHGALQFAYGLFLRVEQFHRDDGFAFEAGHQFGGGAIGDDLAFIDDDHPVGRSLHFLQDVTGHDQGFFLAEVFDQFADFDDLIGVESGGRFV